MTPTDGTGKTYPWGTYAKIARRLGITPQTVRLVAVGKSTSARVSRELRREQRKAELRAARHAEDAA